MAGTDEAARDAGLSGWAGADAGALAPCGEGAEGGAEAAPGEGSALTGQACC